MAGAAASAPALGACRPALRDQPRPPSGPPGTQPPAHGFACHGASTTRICEKKSVKCRDEAPRGRR